MSVIVTVLYALVGSYVALMLLVLAGLLLRRRDGAAPRERSAWPDVDVVVPAHDEAAALPATIDSVLAQDYPGRFTLWLVDDRSSDGTGEAIAAAARRDPRVRALRVEAPSRRRSPKVNAVWHGIESGSAPWIVTTDADCSHRPGWLRALLRPAAGDVVMVLGYVETARRRGARGPLGHYESLDWVSLMLTSRALTRFGWKLASSANNQAYSRAAFEAAGGFGVAARAPSGDEDLLAQRLGRLPGARLAFVDDEDARVLTAPQRTPVAFLRQRRRWVSRYHHLPQYHPVFLLAIALLGLQSIALAAALLASPWLPGLGAAALTAWGVKIAVELVGMHVGLAQLARRDLMGAPVLAWALLHPFVVAFAVLWSLLRPGSWRAGAERYRRRLWRASWRRRAARLTPALPAARRHEADAAGFEGPPTGRRPDRW